MDSNIFPSACGFIMILYYYVSWKCDLLDLFFIYMLCSLTLLWMMTIRSSRCVLLSLDFLVFYVLLQIFRSLGPILHSSTLLLFLFFFKPSYTYYQCFLSWMALLRFWNFKLCDHNCGICNIQYWEEPHKSLLSWTFLPYVFQSITLFPKLVQWKK